MINRNKKSIARLNLQKEFKGRVILQQSYSVLISEITGILGKSNEILLIDNIESHLSSKLGSISKVFQIDTRNSAYQVGIELPNVIISDYHSQIFAEIEELKNRFRKFREAAVLLKINFLLRAIKESFDSLSKKNLKVIGKLKSKLLNITIDIRTNLRRIIRFHFKKQDDCSGNGNNPLLLTTNKIINQFFKPFYETETKEKYH